MKHRFSWRDLSSFQNDFGEREENRLRIDNDLLQRLKLAQEPLLSCVGPGTSYLPESYEEAHNTGRWREAALMAEHVIGTQIPAQTERAMRLNIKALMSNSYGLLLLHIYLPSMEDIRNYLMMWNVYFGDAFSDHSGLMEIIKENGAFTADISDWAIPWTCTLRRYCLSFQF